MSETAWFNVLTIIALLLGPVFAVLVSSFNDDRRLNYNRRMDVFRNLMRTRRLRLTADHVAALNLVEIEFYGETKIIAAWNAYQTFLNTVPSPNGSSIDWQANSKKQAELLTKLLHSMATLLKYDQMQQLDIIDGGYAPQGWTDVELQQQRLRLLLIEICSGNKPIPITTVLNPSPSSPYPPPPDITARMGASPADQPSNN